MGLERSLRNPLVKSKVSKRSISKIEEKTFLSKEKFQRTERGYLEFPLGDFIWLAQALQEKKVVIN